MRKGEAGEVLHRLIEKQSVSVDTLLDAETNRTYHLVEINSAPEEAQELITSLMIGVNRGAVEQAQTIQEKRPTDHSTPAAAPLHSAEPNQVESLIADLALFANRLSATPLETLPAESSPMPIAHLPDWR